MPISNEELLNIPTYIGNEENEESGETMEDEPRKNAPIEDDDDFDLW
jgi:hypothetical protein